MEIYKLISSYITLFDYCLTLPGTISDFFFNSLNGLISCKNGADNTVQQSAGTLREEVCDTNDDIDADTDVGGAGCPSLGRKAWNTWSQNRLGWRAGSN